MRRPIAWWNAIVVAALGTTLAGCGGSSSDEEPEFAPLAQPAAPAAAPAQAQAPTAPAPAAPAPAQAQAPAEEAPQQQARATSSRAAKTPDAIATDDLFALAKAPPGSILSVAPGGDGATPQAAAAPNAAPNSSAAYGSGGMASSGQMPSGYPGADGSSGYPGSAGSASGYHGADGNSGYPGSAGSASGYPGASGGSGYPGAGEGMMAMGGGGGAGSSPEADFSSPIKGAETFLAAAEARDPYLLSHAVALRAPQEATPKNRPLFQKMLDGPQSVDEEILDLLADAVKDMKIVGTNQVRSTARLGVIVGRQEPNGGSVTRTVEMRKEKAGWKVSDISGPRITDPPLGMRGRNQGQAGQGGGRGSQPGSGSGGGYPGATGSGYPGASGSGGSGGMQAAPR